MAGPGGMGGAAGAELLREAAGRAVVRELSRADAAAPSGGDVFRAGAAGRGADPGGALGFPTKSTLIKAINNGSLATFPRLTIQNVNKFFPKFHEIQKGHMKQKQQGLRSTK